MMKVFPDPDMDMDTVFVEIVGVVRIHAGDWPVRMTKKQALEMARWIIAELEKEIEECSK